jgi:hypothetical protein
LNWEVARLLAFEDAINVARSLLIQTDHIRPIRDEPTVGHKIAVRINGWQSMAGG